MILQYKGGGGIYEYFEGGCDQRCHGSTGARTNSCTSQSTAHTSTSPTTAATNNAQYASNGYGLEGGSGRAEVFVGPPRMVRLSAVLELKGLQNRTPKE